MNRGLSEKLKSAFSDVVPVVRPLVENQKIEDPHWLAGFSSAEGCFYINNLKSQSSSIGFQFILVYVITQHIRDENLIISFIEYLKCGYIKKAKIRPNELNYVVTKFDDIINKIILPSSLLRSF